MIIDRCMPNTTVERYLAGFEESVKRLPDTFANWESLDEDLMFTYKDQVEWMLDVRPRIIEMAEIEGISKEETLDKIIEITLKYLELKDQLLEIMGIDEAQIRGNFI